MILDHNSNGSLYTCLRVDVQVAQHFLFSYEQWCLASKLNRTKAFVLADAEATFRRHTHSCILGDSGLELLGSKQRSMVEETMGAAPTKRIAETFQVQSPAILIAAQASVESAFHGTWRLSIFDEEGCGFATVRIAENVGPSRCSATARCSSAGTLSNGEPCLNRRMIFAMPRSCC